MRFHIEGRPLTPTIFQHQIAFNLIPHIDTWVDMNYTKEEMKLVWETRKIMHVADLAVSPTAVRVPVFRSHSESINLETDRKISAAEAQEVFRKAPGVVLVDNPEGNEYPMPWFSTNHDEVFVGRVREDISLTNGLNLWAADQIRKGAATNAVQIVEIVVEDNLF